jgi:hypothetical protein
MTLDTRPPLNAPRNGIAARRRGTAYVVVLPFIIMAVIRALQARYDSHRRWAKWAAPIWLYVSVTGVLVYFTLYHLFPHFRTGV